MSESNRGRHIRRCLQSSRQNDRGNCCFETTQNGKGERRISHYLIKGNQHTIEGRITFSLSMNLSSPEPSLCITALDEGIFFKIFRELNTRSLFEPRAVTHSMAHVFNSLY